MTESWRNRSRAGQTTLWLGVLVLTAACRNPAAPTGDPDAPPAIACPASIVVPAGNGTTADVAFPKPVVTGGASPVATSCTPDIGARFGVGTTGVTCTTTDAVQRSAFCSFDVTVVVPRISATQYVAFGDSITWGSDGMCRRSFQGDPSTWPLQDLQSLWQNVNPPSSAYPGVLKSLLESRYAAQTFVVANEGLPGEAVARTATFDRFLGVLNAHRPEVLVLQQGVNDLHNRSRTQQAVVQEVSQALGLMIREARGRGISVFLGTLLPERVGACRAFTPERIAPANVAIRATAAREGAVLVDLYQEFVGQEAVLLDEDGLHPSLAGYARMGETFFGAIRDRLEER